MLSILESVADNFRRREQRRADERKKMVTRLVDGDRALTTKEISDACDRLDIHPHDLGDDAERELLRRELAEHAARMPELKRTLELIGVEKQNLIQRHLRERVAQANAHRCENLEMYAKVATAQGAVDAAEQAARDLRTWIISRLDSTAFLKTGAKSCRSTLSLWFRLNLNTALAAVADWQPSSPKSKSGWWRCRASRNPYRSRPPNMPGNWTC